MADDQETSNDEGGIGDYPNDGNDGNDIIGSTTTLPTPTTTFAPIDDDAANAAVDDFLDDENLPEVTVKLYIDANPDGVLVPTDVVTGGLTDIYGDVKTTTPWSDAIDNYTSAITQEVYNELTTNATDVAGKRWWGSWSWSKGLIVGLIALCIIGIILALVFCITGKIFKKNKGPETSKGTAAKGSVATGGSQKQEYERVPTSV